MKFSFFKGIFVLMNIEERVREGSLRTAVVVCEGSLSSAVVVCVVLEPKLEKSVVGVTNTLIGKQG